MKILVDGETKEILDTTILGAGGDEVIATARSKI
jgi:pyruvate/2-oxoglutarate dehydrogenase complex dihydrolipoamide dehydrogenase (E3) component